jgi:hypothetical protein
VPEVQPYHRDQIGCHGHYHEPRTRGAFPETRQEPADVEDIGRRREKQRILPGVSHFCLQPRYAIAIFLCGEDQ